jgi:hypothetical protein
MTILTNPPQHLDRHAATRWYRSGHTDETARHTDAWEHETFGEEQARWERRDPEYARICEAVRQAKEKDEQASLSADKTKGERDARVATQRHANSDAQKVRHALTAAQTAKPETASSQTVSSPATEQSTPPERSDAPPGDPRTRSSQVHTTFAIESHASRAAGISPEPVRIHDEPAAARRRPRDETVLFAWPDETR